MVLSMYGRRRVLLGVATVLGLTLLCAVPLAHADDLTTNKNDTQAQIDSNNAQLSQDQAALTKAAADLQTATQDLVDAQADLVAKQQATQDAKDQDAQLSNVANQANETLTARQSDLATAQQAVLDGEAQLESQRNTIGTVVQATTQQGGVLMSLSVVLSDFNTAQLSDHIQWASMVFDATQNAMDQLLQAQLQLQQAQDNAQQAEQNASDAQTDAQRASQIAADHLVVTQNAEATAQQAQDSVAAKVDDLKKAQADAQTAVDADKTKDTQLQQQLAQIEQAIKDAAAANQRANTPPVTSSSSGNVSPSAAQAIAKSLMPNYGFGTDQWSCLVNLWNYESGWRVNARNSSSGAYGIPQALPPTKMATVGADWLTNATTQIKWGLGYIKSRYGNPCGAWSHERSYSWY